MTDPALQQDFAEDVVLLKLVGMNPVVVHGGGPQIDEALAKIGKKGTFIQGMRVTDDETMEVVEWVLAGQVQQDIVGLINVAGGKAVGLTGRDGGLIRARKLKMIDKKDPSMEHDVGQVGEIESIDPSVVKALQDDQFIPVISPLGFGARQRELQHQRRRGGRQAGRGAEGREADDADQHARRARQERQAADQPDARARSTSCSPTARSPAACCRRSASALDAAKSGVNTVHIIDGRVPHAMLLEDADRPGLRHDDPIALMRRRRRARRVWLFDLDDTLHDASHARRCRDLHVSFGRVHPAAPAADAAKSPMRCAAATGSATAPRCSGLVKHHGVDAAHFLHHTHLLPGLEAAVRGHAHDLAALKRLRGRKFILTNAPRAYALACARRARHRPLLRRPDQRSRTCTCSASCGPSPTRACCAGWSPRLRVPASRCVLVEDTLQHQKSARRVGMSTVWMQRWTRAAAKPGVRFSMQPAYVDVKARHLRVLERRLQNAPIATAGAPR